MARLHHIGITVGDLEEATAFYVALTGVAPIGPFEKSGPAVEAATGYPGIVVRQSFLPLADGGAVIELLQYLGGHPEALDPDNGRVGAAHPAVVVDDIDAAVARVAELGHRSLSQPMTASSGPIEGWRYVYVLGPDDVRVELLQAPAAV